MVAAMSSSPDSDAVPSSPLRMVSSSFPNCPPGALLLLKASGWDVEAWFCRAIWLTAWL